MNGYRLPSLETIFEGGFLIKVKLWHWCKMQKLLLILVRQQMMQFWMCGSVVHSGHSKPNGHRFELPGASWSEEKHLHLTVRCPTWWWIKRVDVGRTAKTKNWTQNYIFAARWRSFLAPFCFSGPLSENRWTTIFKTMTKYLRFAVLKYLVIFYFCNV